MVFWHKGQTLIGSHLCLFGRCLSGRPGRVFFFAIILLLVFTGCSSGPSKDDPENPANLPPKEPIVLRVSGYAAMSVPMDKSTLRERLLTMRASKLDAYRAMAEQLYGASLYGNSQVDQMILKSDQFKTLVDTTIRGARVVDVKELQDGGYETVLELTLSPDFDRCVSLVNQFRFEDECRVPMPMGEGFSDAGDVPARTAPSLYSITADKPLGE